MNVIIIIQIIILILISIIYFTIYLILKTLRQRDLYIKKMINNIPLNVNSIP